MNWVRLSGDDGRGHDGSTTGPLYVHLVWSTWDREPVVTTEVQQWLWPMLGEEARRLGCAWAVVGGVEDHVHM